MTTAPADRDRLAICFLAFDRPHYFDLVLNSVRRQSALAGIDVHCFLDGGVNPRSGARHGATARIRRCGRLFTTAFPEGELHSSPVNLGIALNYDRAERHLFLQAGYEYVLFLEDDFVLQPHYVATILAMVAAFGEDPRVGMFSAFGDHSPSLREQRQNRRTIKSMGHSWAYCLPRRRWLAYRGHYARYLRYVRRFDYRMRPQVAIQHQLYKRWGARPVASSQDTAKRIAMLKAGQVQIATYTNNGHYIGRQGTHFTPAVFRRLGYPERAALVFPDPHSQFTWTTADLDRIEASQRAYFLL